MAKVMGKWANFDPHMGSKTPERISMTLGIYNYVGGMTSHANPHGAATTWWSRRTGDMSHVSVS